MNARMPCCLALGLLLASPQLQAQHADHAKHADTMTPAKAPSEATTQAMDHSQMDHGHMQALADADDLPADAPPREPLPALTEAARSEAFPPVHAHHLHGTSLQDYSLIDRLEASDADRGTALGWEASGWIGGDIRRFKWRTEGHASDGKLERASAEALYGQAVRAWWDVVAGIRHDFGEGPGRSWIGVGVEGFAPYKFEVSATAYLGQNGRTALRAEAEYETLLTNRLILQWRTEAEAYGKDDPAIGIGSGLSTVAVGARLRYEFTRQFAPYIGIEHERAFGRSADYRHARGSRADDTQLVAGLRIWF